MERPAKRMRIEDPDIRSPRDPGSRMAEGLFTSELGIRSDDTDGQQTVASPTPTARLTEFTHQAIFGRQVQPAPLQRRAEATVTVAAPEVVVNVNDGTSTIAATTLAPALSDTVISLENLGSVTIPANVTGSETSGLPDTDVSSVTSLPGSITSSTQSPAASVLSEALNSTSSTITADTTITVTTTATLEVSYINGTLFPAVLAAATETTSSDTFRRDSTRSNEATGIIMTEDSTAATAAASLTSAGGEAGATITSEAPAATSSESSGGGGGGTGPALTPTQQSVVGGVVGGIAGIAIILVLILFLLRRYRAKLKAQGRLPEQIAEREAMSGGGSAHGMSQRSSAIPLTTTLASSLRRFRPMSSHTAATDVTASSAPEGERGFQKIAGRKIAPVLSTGGDGYGGDYGAFAKDTGGPSHQRNEHSLAGSSFYRDNHGFYGGRGTDSPTYPPSPTTGTFGIDEKPGPSQTRDFAGHGPRTSSQYSVASNRQEVSAAMRPSPARTPVTISPSPSSIRLPIQHTPTMGDAPPMPPFAPGLQVPDGVGRTLSHQDGSRVSARSRGSARSRFAENV